MLKIKRDWVKAGVNIVAHAGVAYVVKEVVNNLVPQETPKQKVLAFIGRVVITTAIMSPIETSIEQTIDRMAEAFIHGKEIADSQN